MRRGSITVFLSLVLVLMLSFIFSMLEGARIHCLQGEAEYMSRLCGQSVFSNYHRGLWEDYHLLFLDGGRGIGEFDIGSLEGKAMAEAERNLENNGFYGRGLDLLRLQCLDVCADQYLLATDGEGKAFLQAVYRQMQLEIPSDALQELKEKKRQSQSLDGKSQEQDQRWDQAWNAMAEAGEIQEQNQQGQGEPQEDIQGENDPKGEEQLQDSQMQDEPQENPMEYVKQLKASSLLSLVLPREKSLSAKGLAGGARLEERKLQQGTMAVAASDSWKDLTLWYFIQQYFSSFTGQGEKGPEKRSLDYEMEYLIAGNKTDGENLETVVKELLAVREAMNFTTLLGDGGKRGQALALATALVGFTGIAPLVTAVQMGILLAWAFVESVLDVRALLEGKKIPLLKTPGQWSSDIGHCRETIESYAGSPEDEKGLSYKQYLLMLLFLHSSRELSYRCMDLLEANEQIRMDYMVAAAKLEFSYRSKPLFWNMNFLKTGGWKEFSISREAACSYAGGY